MVNRFIVSLRPSARGLGPMRLTARTHLQSTLHEYGRELNTRKIPDCRRVTEHPWCRSSVGRPTRLRMRKRGQKERKKEGERKKERKRKKEGEREREGKKEEKGSPCAQAARGDQEPK